MSGKSKTDKTASKSGGLNRRDRFDDLALHYAECYLGKEQLDSMLHKANGTTPKASAKPGNEVKEGWGQWLRRAFGLGGAEGLPS